MLGLRKSCFRCAITIRTSAVLSSSAPSRACHSVPEDPVSPNAYTSFWNRRRGFQVDTKGLQVGSRATEIQVRRGGALVAHGPQTGKLDRLTPRFGGVQGVPDPPSAQRTCKWGPGLQRFDAQRRNGGGLGLRASGLNVCWLGPDGTRGALGNAPREFGGRGQPSEWVRGEPLRLYQLRSLETSPT